jgi:hypothetical protein
MTDGLVGLEHFCLILIVVSREIAPKKQVVDDFHFTLFQVHALLFRLICYAFPADKGIG